MSSYTSRDVTLTVDGKDVKSFSISPIDFSKSINAINNCKEAFNEFSKSCAKITLKAHFLPFHQWRFKNDLFLNGNRPPRGWKNRGNK